MNKLFTRPLPTITTVTSLLALLVMGLLTNPTVNVTIVAVFLVVLGIFLASFGYQVALALSSTGTVEPKNRYRIMLLSIALVIGIMLRSLNSLGTPEVSLLAGLSIILYFYIGRVIK